MPLHALRAALIATALLSSPPALAQDRSADGNLVVEDAWARATPGTAAPGAAYFTLRNLGDAPARLTDLRSGVAGTVTIHETEIDGQGIARMTAVPEVVIAPGEALTLEPGGLHAMLTGLSEPLVEGETLSLTLGFDGGEELSIDVPVLGFGARGSEG